MQDDPSLDVTPVPAEKKKRKAAHSGRKTKKGSPIKKASFRHGKAKLDNSVDWETCHVQLEVPEELWPEAERRTGKYSYTVRSKNGASVEVHLRARAYFIKACGTGAENEVARYWAWSKQGGCPDETWAILKPLLHW